MKLRSRAFTLIELLVVIAIIALLISILLPNLRQARETARMAVSQANLKQQGLAMFGYNSENKDYWPGDHFEGKGGSWIAWAPRLRAYLGNDQTVTGVFYCPSTPKEFKWVITKAKNEMPPSCTELGYTDTWEQGLNYSVANGPRLYFSYGYNGGGAEWTMPPGLGLGEHTESKFKPLDENSKFMRECKTSDIAIPNRMVAIGDSMGLGSWDTSFFPRDTPGATGLPAHFLGARHLGRCNQMNADFSIRLRDPHDLVISAKNITIEEKRKRIEQWNRQGKAFDAANGY